MHAAILWAYLCINIIILLCYVGDNYAYFAQSPLRQPVYRVSVFRSLGTKISTNRRCRRRRQFGVVVSFSNRDSLKNSSISTILHSLPFLPTTCYILPRLFIYRYLFSLPPYFHSRFKSINL